MGAVCSCSKNNDTELIEKAFRRRMRKLKVDELDYEEDRIETGILSDSENE
jgi:hypothetical protein